MQRLRSIVRLFGAYAVGVLLVSFIAGLYVWLGMVGEGLVLACVVLSQTLSHDARLCAVLAMCGLIFASMLLVHPSGGYVESHILVMMAGIVLHQGLAISKRPVEMLHGSIWSTVDTRNRGEIVVCGTVC